MPDFFLMLNWRSKTAQTILIVNAIAVCNDLRNEASYGKRGHLIEFDYILRTELAKSDINLDRVLDRIKGK